MGGSQRRARALKEYSESDLGLNQKEN